MRVVDFTHQNFDCLGFFRKGKRVVMFNDLGEFRLKLLCCLTGDKKVDRDRERGDKKVDLLTCDKKVSK